MGCLWRLPQILTERIKNQRKKNETGKGRTISFAEWKITRNWVRREQEARKRFPNTRE